jgi:DNA-binding transcriptional regulator YiaG
VKRQKRRTGPSLATLIKAEIGRLAARSSRGLQRRVTRLQKQARALRRASLQQRRELARLERGVLRVRDASSRRMGARPASGPGMSPAAVRSLRSGTGATREQFARQLGVSPGSIFLWETGRARPRAASLARLRQVTASRTRGAQGR